MHRFHNDVIVIDTKCLKRAILMFKKQKQIRTRFQLRYQRESVCQCCFITQRHFNPTDILKLCYSNYIFRFTLL